jgi:hypothetical protein
LSEPVQLSRIIQRVLQGEIRVPGFQRGYVWEPQRAALLMDSIYKGYPVGSILLWRSRSQLATEKSLGNFDLPEPSQDYPIDYVLDGQQRVTSIFATFQTALPARPEDPDVWLPIYYDFEAEPDAQDPQFVALAESSVDPSRHFPLASFFDPIKFAELYKDLAADRLTKIVEVQSRFVGALIPVETFENEDRSSVAIVFERVNRMGVQLDMLQLLTAWTWSDDFDLQAKFVDLSEELESFGFEDVGGDSDLMLRSTAAILRLDPDPTALVDINGSTVREEFERVATSLRLAIDFLRTNLQVRHLRFLPYPALLVPLASFFSVEQRGPITNEQRSTLLRWFWRTSFTHRYSGNPYRNVKSDVAETLKLRQGEDSTLGEIDFEVLPSFFIDRTFSPRTVATRTFVLALASQRPRSFLSGGFVDLDVVLSEPNRKEYHHCFPRAYLSRNGVTDNAEANALVNFAFLSRAENRTISDKAPSEYRLEMPTDASKIARSQLLPDALFADDWGTFKEQRAISLTQLAVRLCD